jgi:hypothetical protein
VGRDGCVEVVGIAVLQSQLWWLTSPSRATSRYLGTWVLGYVPTCCIDPSQPLPLEESLSRSPEACGDGLDCVEWIPPSSIEATVCPRPHVTSALAPSISATRATDDAPSCLHLTTTWPSIIHHNGCTYPPRMPASPRRSARPNPAPCFSYRHLDSFKASTARCTSDRPVNFSHARLPDGHTSFSTCLSPLDAQPPFGYLRPIPYTHLTSSRRLSTM